MLRILTLTVGCLCFAGMANTDQLVPGKKLMREHLAAEQGRGSSVSTLPPLLLVRTDSVSYRLGGSIRLEVLIANQSTSTYYIYSPLEWGESANLALVIRHLDSGTEVHSAFIADALTPPPVSERSFIRLLPNHFYGLIERLSLQELNLTKAGSYKLAVVYHSPVPKKVGFSLPIWGREQGQVVSNELVISVRQ